MNFGLLKVVQKCIYIEDYIEMKYFIAQFSFLAWWFEIVTAQPNVLKGIYIKKDIKSISFVFIDRIERMRVAKNYW